MTSEGKQRLTSQSDSSNSGPNALDWVGHAGLTDQFLGKIAARTRRRRRRQQAITGSLTAMLLLGFIWSSVSTRKPANLPVESNATVFLPARQILPDGSIVELNAGAQIVVAFSDTVRRVVLKGGEAHFQVAKNPRKPFVVEAGEVDVRAMGTAFLVQLGPQIEVLVTEGRVAVDLRAANAPESPSEARPPLALLDAGFHGMMSATSSAGVEIAPQIVTRSETEIRERLLWRIPRLEFNQAPLATVISLINQHGHVHLSLRDPELGKVELSGILRADNIDALLQMLRSNYGIEAERSHRQIILHRLR